MKLHNSHFLFSILLMGVLLLACMPDEPSPKPDPEPEPIDTVQEEALTFLALGDSYTIGESVGINLRWPVQLKDSLIAQGLDMESPRIIARTGWTTDELIQAISNTGNLDPTYDLVSLLIGVNNQYRKYNFVEYEREFPVLLRQALNYAGGDTNRVIVLSIPDYGVTPFGSFGDPEEIARELDEYNAFAKEEAEKKGIDFYDITPISREAEDDRSLVASDGLHPSGKMYTRWVELIREEVQAKLDD
ncbi:MAG: SGNH/GDSL hydrolase family protein [Bacteroidota bacterium]